jgi:hypothetical protein
VNKFIEDLQNDIDEVFLNEEEFATPATLFCESFSKDTKIIFNLDPEMMFNNEFSTKALFIYLKKEDLICNKPKIKCKYGEFSTLYKEDDGSGILKIYISRDEVKKIDI